MKVISSLAALFLGAALSAQQPDVGPPPGRLFDVGGRRMHLLCTGSGTPTVVFEAGGSAFAIDFTLVQRELTKTTRVCSYDRAGFGWSDPSTSRPRASIAHDLHSLLAVADERPPYVLVGASFGGLYVREYQADYPADVAGLVLLDPVSEERLFTYFDGNAVTIASLTAEQLRTTIAQRDVRVRRRQPQTGAPFNKLPPDLYETRIKLDTRLIASGPDEVSYLEVLARAEEERARLARMKALSAAVKPLGDLPVVVLSRGVELGEGLHETHAAIAHLSRNGRHAAVDGAGHEIHLFAPHAVITAVGDVLTSALTRKPLQR